LWVTFIVLKTRPACKRGDAPISAASHFSYATLLEALASRVFSTSVFTLILLWFGFRLLPQVDFQHALVIVGGLLAPMRGLWRSAYRDAEAPAGVTVAAVC